MSNDKAALHILEKALEDWQASPEGMQLQKDAEARRLVWETLDQLRDHPAVQASPRVLGSLNTVLEELHSVFNPADVLAVTQREAIAQQTRNTGAKKAAEIRHAGTGEVKAHILDWCEGWACTHRKASKNKLADDCSNHAAKWNEAAGHPFKWGIDAKTGDYDNEKAVLDARDYIRALLKPSKRGAIRA